MGTGPAQWELGGEPLRGSLLKLPQFRLQADELWPGENLTYIKMAKLWEEGKFVKQSKLLKSTPTRYKKSS
jgi:hypothetical protein